MQKRGEINQYLRVILAMLQSAFRRSVNQAQDYCLCAHDETPSNLKRA